MRFPSKQSIADQTTNRAMLFGMALCSFSALLLELALTRLFSVVLFYHFAFLAISIALLGLGAGGVFAHLRKSQLARFETRALVCRLSSIEYQPSMAAPGADCCSLATLCRRTARSLGTDGGLALHRKALGQWRAAGAVGFRHGHAVPYRPAGLRRSQCDRIARPPADDTGGNLVEWAWAINAASSVLGSVLAMVIAIQLGLNITLATGAAAYLAALLLTTTLRPAHEFQMRSAYFPQTRRSWR